MISESLTYPVTTGFNSNGDPCEEDREEALGGHGEGIYSKGGVRANGD